MPPSIDSFYDDRKVDRSQVAFPEFQRVSHRGGWGGEGGGGAGGKRKVKQEEQRKEKELSRSKSALALSRTSPQDILSRVYLRGASVINHGFVCLPESIPGGKGALHARNCVQAAT